MEHRRIAARSGGAALIIAASLSLGLLAAVPVVRAADTPLEADRSSIDFGDVDMGMTSADVAVTITNTDSAPFGPLVAAGGAPLDPEFGGSQNCANAVLAPGASCTFSYHFTPSAPGVFTSSTLFTLSGEDFPVTFTGTGLYPLDVGPTSLDFGDVPVGSTSGSLAVTFTNISPGSFGPLMAAGGAPLDPEFGGSQNCANATLASGGSCTFSYDFTPSAVGTFTSNTVIGMNGENFAISFMGCGFVTPADCAAAPTPTPTPSPTPTASPSPTPSATPMSSPSASPSSSAGSPAGESATPTPVIGVLPDTADAGTSPSPGAPGLLAWISLAALALVLGARLREGVRHLNDG